MGDVLKKINLDRFNQLFDNNVLSIDIGTYDTKMVLGKQQNKIIHVEDAWMIKTPENAFYNGQIVEIERLQNEISRSLMKRNIKTKKVICTVESTSIITREITLPITKSQEMQSMVQYEMEQYLPIMLSEYVVEYKILEELIEDNIKKARVLVVALPKSIAEKYFNLVRDIDLQPVALDIHSNAVAKLFSSVLYVNNENSSLDKTVAIIDLGHNNINVSIITKGVAQFNRLITFGGKDIDINLANSFNLSLEEAENRKIETCNLKDLNSMNASVAMMNEEVKTAVDFWGQEIQRIFQYYTSRGAQNSIDEIYLCGGSANLKGVPRYMEEYFNLPTFFITNISSIKTGIVARNIELGRYLNSIGAIIRR